MKIQLPEDIKYILDKLNENDHKAYIVGGCVRDSIMKRNPSDWDITTDATPLEVMDVFKELTVLSTGIKHGTVTVMLDGKSYEITTFRVEGMYSDHRRPDYVEYASHLKDDLSRRDFTINAMAYNESEGLTDLFGGLNDIRCKLIRCVGDAGKRFGEDALRMLRAIRFSAQLGFKIEESTLIAIKSNSGLIRHVSSERIRYELDKTLLSDNLDSIIYLLSTNLLEHIIPECKNAYDQNLESYSKMIKAMDMTDKDISIRLTVFLYYILNYSEDKYRLCNDDSGSKAEGILKRLRYDNNTVYRVKKLMLYKDCDIPENKESIKRWLGKLGVMDFERLLHLKEACLSFHNNESLSNVQQKLDNIKGMFHEILKNNECFSLGMLSVNGDDLKSLGYTEGKEIGNILNSLLDAVIKNPNLNEKDRLIKYLMKDKNMPKGSS